jgi:hypothetical protein
VRREISETEPSRSCDPTLQLAQHVGIEPEDVSARGQRVVIGPEVLRAVLAAMNIHVSGEKDARDQLEALDQRERTRKLPPVTVIREERQPVRIPLQFDAIRARLPWRLVLEGGHIVAQGIADKESMEPAGSADHSGSSRR